MFKPARSVTAARSLIITLTNETWVEELGAGPNEATRKFALGLSADVTNENTCQEFDKCQDCEAGQSSLEGSEECFECPPGSYSHAPGAPYCVDCPAGSVILCNFPP